jgi:Ca-activated chloride channel family protein
MWGPIDGTPKVEAAEAGLSRLIDALEGRADVGLMGYGHRRKSDCRDIELAFPPGRIDAASAKAWLGRFSPRGKTPMAAALQRAGESLAQVGGGHIVVVTDGTDNCRQEPCATAAALTAADANLRMHVVILGTTEEDIRRTRCIAETGQGLVEEVASPADLDPALDRVIAAITGSPAPVGDSEVVAAGPPGLRLSLRLGPEGAELATDIAWVVTRDGNEVYAGSTPRPALDLAPGTYVVMATKGGIKVERTVDVGADGPTAAVLDLGAGIVRIALQAGAGAAEVSDAYYTIYRADPTTGVELQTVAVGRGSPPPLLLPAGSYRAIFEQGLTRIERALNVEAGREIASSIAFDIGTLQVATRAVEGGPVLDNVYITVVEDDPEAPGGRREVATSAAAEPIFTLRAGLYHLRVENGRAAAAAEATVRGGEATVQEVIVPSGRLRLSSRVAGSPDTLASLVAYSVESLEEGAKDIFRVNGPTASLTLAAGRYRVTGHYGTANARAQREVVVAAGSDETVTIEHEAGVVAFAIMNQAKPRNVQWTVRRTDGRALWSTADPAPEVPLAAGDYEVEARLGTRVLTERFNVAPGESKTVEVRPE